ncbi:MAG TPA: type II toxin-antitoxin system Phd/YefM family antitoxin [Pyrinomonadaceae bacterium]|jgi:prevent-host-death family protein
MAYSVKEAKDKLSRIIRLAEKGEPQVIRRHDRAVAVVVSIEDWENMNGRNGKKTSLVEFLQESPLDEILPFMTRADDEAREVSFD